MTQAARHLKTVIRRTRPTSSGALMRAWVQAGQPTRGYLVGDGDDALFVPSWTEVGVIANNCPGLLGVIDIRAALEAAS